MSARYLLTCSGCQKQVPVEAGRAGGNVTCECGETLEVPTMRALRELPQETAPAEAESVSSPVAASAESNWGPKQGVLLLGLILFVAGLIPTLYMAATYPKLNMPTQEKMRDIAELQFDQMTLTRSWEVWKGIIEEQGLTTQPTLYEANYEKLAGQHNQWLAIFGSIAGLGFLTLLAGLFIRN